MRFVRPFTLIAALLACFAAAGTAVADESRSVGQYQIDAGFRHTPVYTDEMNALVLTVRDGSGRPVEGLASALTVDVSTLGRTQPLDLRPVLDRPGQYEAVLVPPSSGEYTFDVRGTIQGTP